MFCAFKHGKCYEYVAIWPLGHYSSGLSRKLRHPRYSGHAEVVNAQCRFHMLKGLLGCRRGYWTRDRTDFCKCEQRFHPPISCLGSLPNSVRPWAFKFCLLWLGTGGRGNGAWRRPRIGRSFARLWEFVSRSPMTLAERVSPGGTAFK
jgi:hypothetical protein